jgi:hypothetical protein
MVTSKSGDIDFKIPQYWFVGNYKNTSILVCWNLQKYLNTSLLGTTRIHQYQFVGNYKNTPIPVV